MIFLTQTSPVSNLTTTDKVDTDVNKNDDSRPFDTPIKHNHSASKLCDKNNMNTQVHPKVYPRLFK